ncbi:MAG: bifunctional metallophosphatase/5'-nucleotidase, partial [Actinomycetales bacterium]|nr:bifunctional metallophosphatase/5'-nucleotidase [Actinomycetales bacterium]
MAWRSRAVGAAFGAAAIGAAGLAPALAATPVDAIDESLTKVTIFNINDFHGRIGGSAGLDFACTVVKEQVAAGEYAFLSAGDNIGATPFISSSQQDAPT